MSYEKLEQMLSDKERLPFTYVSDLLDYLEILCSEQQHDLLHDSILPGLTTEEGQGESYKALVDLLPQISPMIGNDEAYCSYLVDQILGAIDEGFVQVEEPSVAPIEMRFMEGFSPPTT